jgi:acetyl-CoA C-acetyltransferase
VRSHLRASSERDGLAAEIVPLTVIEAKKPVVRSIDEGPRPDCNLEMLGKLTPVFSSSLLGSEQSTHQATVTAGNASTLSDGAAALVVVNEANHRTTKTDWAFRVVGHCHYAGHHEQLFTAPVGAVRRLLQKTRHAVADVDLFEINEAFAAQTLACINELGLDPDRVNVRGGAIALGHPLGCSGARVLVTLIHNLLAQGRTRGVATLCLGGGEAVAMMIERAH